MLEAASINYKISGTVLPDEGETPRTTLKSLDFCQEDSVKR